MVSFCVSFLCTFFSALALAIADESEKDGDERKRSNTPPESIRGQKIKILLPTQKSGSWIVLSKKRKTRNRKTTFSIWLTD